MTMQERCREDEGRSCHANAPLDKVKKGNEKREDRPRRWKEEDKNKECFLLYCKIRKEALTN